MFTIQQEILVFLNNFSQLHWSEKEITEAGKQLPQTDQQEITHKNDWLEKLQSEIEDQPDFDKKLFLVQIWQGESSLYIQLGASTVQLDGQHSIDPYLFIKDWLLYN